MAAIATSFLVGNGVYDCRLVACVGWCVGGVCVGMCDGCVWCECEGIYGTPFPFFALILI